MGKRVWRPRLHGKRLELRDGGELGDRPALLPVQAGVAKPLRYRHDGFTPERRRVFLETLSEQGIVSLAARQAGVSRTTARRWRDKAPGFAREWDLALARASTPIDLIAFERATIGAERVVMHEGKVVLTERKPSDTILRTMMLTAAAAKARAHGDPQKREAVVQDIMAKIEKLKNPHGWPKGPEGALVPPGYRLVRIADDAEEDVVVKRPSLPRPGDQPAE